MSFPLYFAYWPGQVPAQAPSAACGFCIGADGSLIIPPLAAEASVVVFHDGFPIPPDSQSAAEELAQFCDQHHSAALLCDLERPPCAASIHFIHTLGSLLPQSTALILPEAYAAVLDSAWVLLRYDPIRQTVADWRQHARSAGRKCVLELEPIHRLLSLPVQTDSPCRYNYQELIQLRSACGAAAFYSEELACNYFSFQQENAVYLGLYDTAQTIRGRLAQMEDMLHAAVGLAAELEPFLSNTTAKLPT